MCLGQTRVQLLLLLFVVVIYCQATRTLQDMLLISHRHLSGRQPVGRLNSSAHLCDFQGRRQPAGRSSCPDNLLFISTILSRLVWSARCILWPQISKQVHSGDFKKSLLGSKNAGHFAAGTMPLMAIKVAPLAGAATCSLISVL